MKTRRYPSDCVIVCFVIFTSNNSIPMYTMSSVPDLPVLFFQSSLKKSWFAERWYQAVHAIDSCTLHRNSHLFEGHVFDFAKLGFFAGFEMCGGFARQQRETSDFSTKRQNSVSWGVAGVILDNHANPRVLYKTLLREEFCGLFGGNGVVINFLF